MTDEEKLIVRILDVLPPGSFELSTFLGLFRIKFSNEVESAAVTCADAPTLLLNRDFIEAHCRTDEHLFMLVMHELYHVILGHTALFPRATKVRNLVFDAVINALLCSLFPNPAFTSFFTDYYSADQMPFALLRPPGAGTPPEAQAALSLLYGTAGDGTYHDVYEALVASGCVKEVSICVPCGGRGATARLGDGGRGATAQPGDGRAGTPCPPHPLLLGSHGNETADADLSQEMKDLMDAIMAKWPSPDRPLRGCDRGADERKRDFGVGTGPDAALRRGLARLLRGAALPGPKEIRVQTRRTRTVETTTFWPDCRDRTHAARERLLGDALLYHSACAVRRPACHDNRQAFVYFDVSGSVADKVPSVAAALLPHVRRGRCRVHVFSTVVREASVRDLAAHRFDSTGGTDIDCVLRHVLDLPRRQRPRAVVVVTDGDTGTPDATLAAQFRATGMRLFVGLVEAGPDATRDLAPLAERFVNLL